MANQGNQSELDRYWAIILATIEYDSIHNPHQSTPQEKAYNDNFHKVWKAHVEDHYNNGSLDKLKKSFDHITLVHKLTGNLDYVQFIKEKTGYDFDLFGNINERIDKIISRNRIANSKERKDVGTMMSLYRKTGIGQENAALLINLQNLYHESKSKKQSTKEFFLHNNHLLEKNSPDNKRYVSMYENILEGNQSTYINIHFEDGVLSSAYVFNNINLNIKVYWENNNKLVIQTPFGYECLMNRKIVQHLTDIIHIEHIEN